MKRERVMKAAMKMKNKYYKLLGFLLAYPTDDWVVELGTCQKLLEKIDVISNDQHQSLTQLFDYLQTTELLDLEVNYVNLFDFRHLLSLHLFEHLYGDSRDRGQAMVDLVAQYEQANLQLNVGEMPDYLPVFLEYLTRLPCDEASQKLGIYVDTLALLEARLKKHASPYAVIFSILVFLSAAKPDDVFITKKMQNYAIKIDYKALDKLHEEPEVFAKPEACVGKTACSGKNEDIIHFMRRE